MTLAKLDRRSRSAMAAELIEWAMKQPEWKDKLEEAAETVGSVPAKPDPRGYVSQRQLVNYAAEQAGNDVDHLSTEPQIDGNQFTSDQGMERLAKAEKLLEAMEMMEMMEKMRKLKEGG